MTTPRLTDALLRELLTEQGWTVRPGRFGPIADSPIHHWNKVTPEWAIRPSSPLVQPYWPGETYTELRQVSWQVHGGRMTLFIRESPAPWIGVTTRQATQKAVRAYAVEYGKAAVEQAMSEAAEAVARTSVVQ